MLIMFRYLWKLWEGGKMKMLVQGKCKNIPFLLIRVGVVYFVTHCQYSTAELNLPIVEADIKNDRLNILVDYFNDTRHNHDGYTFRFFFCELLNFVNVVGQIYFMDFFLGGEFTTYGSDVLAMSELPQEDRYDPMAAVFPKVTLKRHKFITIFISPRSQNVLSTSSVLLELSRGKTASAFFPSISSTRRSTSSSGSGSSSLLSSPASS